jgi:hypothetical protein
MTELDEHRRNLDKALRAVTEIVKRKIATLKLTRGDTDYNLCERIEKAVSTCGNGFDSFIEPEERINALFVTSSIGKRNINAVVKWTELKKAAMVVRDLERKRVQQFRDSAKPPIHVECELNEFVVMKSLP